MTVTCADTKPYPAADIGCGEGAGKTERISREQLLAALVTGGNDFRSWWLKSGELLSQHEISVQDLMEAAYMAGTVRAGAAPGQLSAPPVPAEVHYTGVKHFDIEPEVFSHAENGGRYEVIATAIGEGSFQNAEIMVFRCLDTGFYLFRTPAEFEQAMVLADCPSGVGDGD